MGNSESPRSGRDLTGELLDNRYRVEEKLGEGGMATVYLASDERLGRRVVVKAPLEIFLTVSGFRERFAQEIHALISLDHPFIGKILDRGETSGIPFAVLQYLPGGSLMARIEEAGGRLTPEQIGTWLPRVASALDFIHSRDFLHRDIKPANILFDSEQNVYIADFGIAKVLGDKEFTNLTQTGTLPGTVAYMAPEAGEHRTPGPEYDQYALAVVVYQALTGDLPHEMGDSPISALVQKIVADPVPLGQLRPDLPSDVSVAVMKALSTSPTNRFSSCREFADAFVAGMAGVPAGVEAPAQARGTETDARAPGTTADDATSPQQQPTTPTGGADAAEPPPTVPFSSSGEINTVVLPERPPRITPNRSPVVMPDEGARFDPLESISKPRWRLPVGRLTEISLARATASLPRIDVARLAALLRGLPRPGLPALPPGARRPLLIGGAVAVAAVVVVGIALVVVNGPSESSAPAGGDTAGATRAAALPPVDPPSTDPSDAQRSTTDDAADPPLTTEATPSTGDDEPGPAPAAAATEDRSEDAPVGAAAQTGAGADADEPAATDRGTPEPPAATPQVEIEQPAAVDDEPAAVGETRSPQRISAATPEYPALPFALGIEGEVSVEATIDANGDVTEVTVTSGLHPDLDRAAVEAVRQWKYEPALRNGEPREYPLTARLVFDLPPVAAIGPVEDARVESARQLDTARFMSRLAAALAEFRSRNGVYAETLDQLQPLMGTVPELDSWDTPFWYRRLDDGYWLISFGRDGAPGPAAPSRWIVGDAFEADFRMHSGEFEQAPENADAADAAPSADVPTADLPTAAEVAAIETVPITDDVIPPVLDPESVVFLVDRTVQDQIGLTTRGVSVYCLVRADGSVAEARVIQVDPEIPIASMARAFADSARRSAIDAWRFQPATREGAAVAVWRLVSVRYQPQR